MTDLNLAKLILELIGRYGISESRNLFVTSVLPNLIDAGLDTKQTISNDAYIRSFAYMINDKDLQLSNLDIEPILHIDYWNLPNLESFNYVARALPLVRLRYPKVYKDIYKNGRLLPAGLDKRNNPNANTIYNAILNAEENDANVIKNDKQERAVKNALSKLGVSLSSKLLDAVINLVSALANK